MKPGQLPSPKHQRLQGSLAPKSRAQLVNLHIEFSGLTLKPYGKACCVQGESDCARQEQAQQWPSKFTSFVSAVRCDLSLPFLAINVRCSRSLSRLKSGAKQQKCPTAGRKAPKKLVFGTRSVLLGKLLCIQILQSAVEMRVSIKCLLLSTQDIKRLLINPTRNDCAGLISQMSVD